MGGMGPSFGGRYFGKFAVDNINPSLNQVFFFFCSVKRVLLVLMLIA